MAYVIVNTSDNEIYRIAENDAAKNDQNVLWELYSAVDITDEEFTKIKTNAATVTVSGGSATVTDVTGFSSEGDSKENLQAYHTNIKTLLKGFLDNNPSSKSLYSAAQTYYNYLNVLDYDSLSYPLNKGWEKYCEDNSISYLHALQIP
jgi:hypothetical protein|tara:strand:+ start:693 stop:1136 length:444 start_codon:yes stop_codon:yes gene_type:complete